MFRGFEFNWARAFVIMAAYSLHAGSQTPDFIRAMDLMHADALTANQRIADLEAKLAARSDAHKKDWTELKSFQYLGSFDGSDKDFLDLEFDLQRFVRPFALMEE